MTRTARMMAALIAATAIGALAGQVIVTSRLPRMAGMGDVIWTMAAYFTVLINLLVAISFSWMVASGRQGTAAWNGGQLLWIVAVAIPYHTLLAGIWAPQGLAWWADQGLHTATPVLVAVWWLAFAPKAPLHARHPWLWAAVPIAYCVYAMVRGQMTGLYPYPFVDVAAIGPLRVAQNVAALTAGFILGGYGLLWLAHRAMPMRPA